MQLFFLQVTDSLSAVAGASETSLSLLDLLLKAGYTFMVPLLILSFLGVYIFIERFIKIENAGRVDKDFMSNIRNLMKKGNIEAAIDLCRAADTPTSRMVEKGIRRIGKPLRSIEVAIENIGKLELLQLEKRLPTLATIAGAAPMIGFLGTVTGMIDAFYQISSLKTSVVDPGVLAGGIYQALITTAAGLAIGIVAYVGYNYLVAKVETVVFQMEATTVAFIDFLQEPAK